MQIHFITLQGALIHTGLHISQIHYITEHLNTYGNIHRYNLHLQYRYIISTGRLYTDSLHCIIGRLNTYVTLHFTYSYWGHSYFFFLVFDLDAFFLNFSFKKNLNKSIRADYVGTRLASSLFYSHFSLII